MYIMAFSRDLYGGVADTFGNIIIFGRTTMAVIVVSLADRKLGFDDPETDVLLPFL